MGLIDFAAGVGETGRQLGTEAIRSIVEEQKAARLAEMQNRFAVARDEAGRTFTAGQNQADRDFRAGEARIDRDFRSTEAVKADDRARERMYDQASIAEEAATNAHERGQADRDRQFALQERQLGISAGHLALSREQMAMGRQIIGEDGRIAFVVPVRGPDGKTTMQVTGYLKGQDGKDFVAQKNIGEAAKMEYTALGERIKALDKQAAEAVDPAAADRARVAIAALTDRQRQILGVTKPGAEEPVIRDRFAPKPKDGDAQFEDMKRRGAAATRGDPAPRRDAQSAPESALIDAGRALETGNKTLRDLGNVMRLTDGAGAASARAAYLQMVRDLQSGRGGARAPMMGMIGG